MVEINYSKNTIGCRVGGEIFIHPELYKNPKLYHAIISHEKKHSDGLTGHDIAIDVFNDDLKDCKKEFYMFILKHPRTMLGYFPVTKVGKYWAFDLQMLVAWMLTIGIVYFVGSNL